MSLPDTGMDNQHERAGYWLDRFNEGVDLNCYLVRELPLPSPRLAQLGGKDALALVYDRKATERAACIRALLWDEAERFLLRRQRALWAAADEPPRGWACAMNADPGPRIRVKSVSAFTVLWANVATPEQARRMVHEHLLNVRRVLERLPVPVGEFRERWYSQDFHPADLGCNWRAHTGSRPTT